MKAIQTFIYCGVAVVILGVFNVWTVLHLYDAARSYNWPHVTGRIISSVARYKLMRGRHGEFITHWPDVRYEYVVGDRRFVSDRIMFTHRGFSKSETQRLIDAYAVNKIIAVYFDPKKPELSGAATRYPVVCYSNTCVRNNSDGADGVDYLR